MTNTHAHLKDHMWSAVEASTRHVDEGGLPFVGVVVDASGIVSCFGVNEVQRTHDPSAHAEIVAMRDAMSTLDRESLAGTMLLATGEPCGLCYRFAIDHGIDTIYTALDRDIVARWGFDYRGSYPAMGITDDTRDRLLHHLTTDNADEPFVRYLEKHSPRGTDARALIEHLKGQPS